MDTGLKKFIVNVEIGRLVKMYRPDFNLVERDVTGFGIVHRFENVRTSTHFSLQAALYANDSLAHAAVENQAVLLSVGPTKIEKPIGDELLVWKVSDPRGGSVLFRRTNAVIYLTGELTLDERLKLLEQIDQDLQKNIPEVNRGDTVLPPEIVKVNLPPVVKVGKQVTGTIEVGNIEPNEVLIGTENTNVIVNQENRLTLTYYAPSEPGQDKIILLVSTQGNLLSKKAISIKVE